MVGSPENSADSKNELCPASINRNEFIRFPQRPAMHRRDSNDQMTHPSENNVNINLLAVLSVNVVELREEPGERSPRQTNAFNEQISTNERARCRHIGFKRSDD